MRKLIILLFLLVCSTAYADLYYNTYRGTGAYPSFPGNGGTLTYPTVLSTGTVTAINHNWGSGQVLNSGRSEQVIVKYWGLIYVPGTGSQTLTFYNSSDDGFYMKVNNQVVINDWEEQGPNYYNGVGSITLTGGQYYPIEVWYYENGGGAAAQLYWNQSGSIALVPTSSYYLTQPVPQNQTVTGTTSGITIAQSARRTNLINDRNNISGNSIYIDQVGSNNNIDITQSGNNNSIQGINQQRALLKGDGNTIVVKQGNSFDGTGKNLIKLELNTGSNSNTVNLYQGYDDTGTMNPSDSNGHIISLNLLGSSNQIKVYQTNLGGNNAGHFAELNTTGSTNNITVNQKGNGSKTLFTTVNGNSNTVSALQDGLGQQYLDISLTGNGHTVNANQTGTGNHLGYINLTNGGGASTVNLTQSGSTAQNYSITQTCVNPAGCSVSVTQP